MKKRRNKVILIFIICVACVIGVLVYSSTGGTNDSVMYTGQSVEYLHTRIQTKNVIPLLGLGGRGLDKGLFKQLKEEASSVTLRYPAKSSEQLWIELDHKRTLIRRVAYYDTRPLGTGSRRSLVIVTLHNDRDEPVKPVLYIKIFYNDTAVFCIPLTYWEQIGGYKPVLKDYLGAYLMQAQLDTNHHIPPTLVSIARDKHCSRDSLLPAMPVFADISNNNKEGVFSVCTGKALYGNIDPQWVVHWIELNLALGATYITILIQDITDDMHEAVLPYSEEGLVELIDWRISIVNMHEKGMWASLQECIYRNINRAQYLNLHDIDEILMPQRPHRSWHNLVGDLGDTIDTDRVTDYASFSFPNAYWFDIGLPIQSAQDNLCKGMQLPEYFKRTDRTMNPEYRHPKPMLSLESVIASDIHEISAWAADKEKQLLVPASLGQSFHYRTPIREEDYRKHNRTYDPSFMLPYVQPIMSNLRKRYCKIQ